MKRIMAVAVPLALLISLFPAAVAFAQETVPTEAQISASANPPVVLYKFEVPDADSSVADIQYDSDDGALFQAGAQIAPNLEDLPEAQKIAYWWVATDPNGIDDIVFAYVKVWHPDGTLKYQLETVTPSACSALGTWATPNTPLYAAYRSGQLTTAQADLIVENCTKHVWVPFMRVGELSKHQPAGMYTVIAYVNDHSGAVGSLTNFMEVLPVVGLQIDFTGVNFGAINPSTEKWVRGDMDMTTPTLPSVKNVGNVNMYLSLNFSTMVGIEFGKVIDTFDGQLNAQLIDPIPAGVPACFNLEPLGSNEVDQLDLSIHPGPVSADIYRGTLVLSGGQSC